MMATTHAAVGIALAATLVPTVPALAPVAAVGAAVGGVLPDLDVCWTHRRTLHYPVLSWAAALPALVVTAAMPGPATVAVASFLCGAALHATSDALAGGSEPRPWERTTDDAVYCHLLGRWLRARRWVGYAGSPGDLALLVAFAVPGLWRFDGALRWVLALGVVGSAIFALRRMRQAGDLPRLGG